DIVDNMGMLEEIVDKLDGGIEETDSLLQNGIRQLDIDDAKEEIPNGKKQEKEDLEDENRML
ncbi:hypothetical protein ACJMK2_044721, partial [Sinanodonta woodiana]